MSYQRGRGCPINTGLWYPLLGLLRGHRRPIKNGVPKELITVAFGAAAAAMTDQAVPLRLSDVAGDLTDGSSRLQRQMLLGGEDIPVPILAGVPNEPSVDELAPSAHLASTQPRLHFDNVGRIETATFQRRIEWFACVHFAGLNSAFWSPASASMMSFPPRSGSRAFMADSFGRLA